MAYFDASQKWIILAGAAARNAAGELACYVSLLRERAGCGGEKPAIESAETFSSSTDVPVIIVNAGDKNSQYGGFAWRAGKNRIELYGDSSRGLWNAVFDFLSALGFSCPKPGVENPPGMPDAAPLAASCYALKEAGAFAASVNSPKERRRLPVGGKSRPKERDALIRWAACNKIDALVFSLGEKFIAGQTGGSAIKRYALIIEAGGGDLSLLLPRRLFFFHRDLFRMEGGRRTARRHFCPTNPETTSRVMERAEKLFGRAASVMAADAVKVFHLWPDAGFENTWCSCPACRAFSPAEQYRIAANTAAFALAKVDPDALLSFWEDTAAGDGETKSKIAPRGNMFPLKADLSISPAPDRFRRP